MIVRLSRDADRHVPHHDRARAEPLSPLGTSDRGAPHRSGCARSTRRPSAPMLMIMAVAMTIDVMRPATLAFVVPGMAQESGLRSPLHPVGVVPVAYLPLSGTVAATAGAIRESEAGNTLAV